jgi:hypothetical protein
LCHCIAIGIVGNLKFLPKLPKSKNKLIIYNNYEGILQKQILQKLLELQKNEEIASNVPLFGIKRNGVTDKTPSTILK